MYQVLARKYRSRNFNELVGQNHVSRALTSALDRGRLHHAYLFTGTRGVGKTTIARILAKCLNCETGVTSTPCEVCPTCVAVNEGRFIDLIEIDAASRTKVEDTRELLDNVPYAPTQGRFKVYLIDEVHMLSTHSFNALLKTLEEPPEHVKFLFATTDPQKLPITVISRCLQFTLRPLAIDEITTHLTQILAQESIAAEQDAIWQIAESAQGSMRDALSLTDQAIAYGQGAIQHQDVKEMLGLIDRTIIYDLILAIHQNQKARVSALLLQFRQQALDVSMVLDQLITTLHELALLQYLPELALKYSAEINQKIMQLSAVISAQDLQLYYQVACKGRADLHMAVTQEQGFEMTVLRLLAFRPLQPNEVLVSQAQTEQHVPIVAAPATPLAVTEHAVAPVQNDPSPVVTNHDDYDLDTYDEGGFEQRNTTSIDEPSSDDFLDEDEPTQAEHVESNIVQTAQTISVAPISVDKSPASNSEDTIVFDASAQDGLFGFDVIEHAEPVVEITDTKNDGVLHDFSTPVVSQSSIENTQVIEQPVDAIVQTSQVTTTLTPQQILTLSQPEMTGEWTVEKWEYWFRHSDLSPAVQELAQYGVMQGEINASSSFIIPKQYEPLLVQLQHVLEGALKHDYPETFFQVQFAEVDGTTPYQLQQQRREKAYARASEMLQTEPVVQSLLQSFDGQLHNIELKP